jgi:transposase
LEWAKAWPVRTWAAENASGLGYLLAQQLVAAGERVVDVQPKLAARVRLLDNGSTNKNDPNDARSVAVTALRAKSLAEVAKEDHAAELLGDLHRLDGQLKELRERLVGVVAASRTATTKSFGVGPVVAAMAVGITGDVGRFPDKDHFAAYNGTAPIEVSSGPKKLYRLSMRGNRRLNHAVHLAAVTQVRHRHSEGRAYYDRKVAEGKTGKEFIGCLKRRISDALYAAMVADARRAEQEEYRSGGPGGQTGTAQ